MATQRDTEDFKELLQMLAWKRHEQPPPGYFDTFSVKIIARIESDQPVPSWWQRFFSLMDPKPIYAGAFGLTVCGTLLFGLLFQATPQADQALLHIDELSNAWSQTENDSTKNAAHTRGLAVYRGESSITPVINTESFDSVWKSGHAGIFKASFKGF